MKLADALAEEASPPRLPQCPVARLRLALDDTDRTALDRAIARIAAVEGDQRSAGNSPWTVDWLRNVLINNGHAVGSPGLRRHLRGDCACGNL